MKKTLYLIVFFLSAALFSCAGSGTEPHTATGQPVEESTGAHGEGKQYTSAYVCPMHCAGSGSEAAGQCPACGMDYVMFDEHVKDGHDH